MPTDPTISLDIRQPQASAGPLDMIGKFADVQNSLNQNLLFRQTLQARQRMGQIIAQSPDTETALQTMQKDPIAGPFAGEYMNYLRQMQLSQVQMAGEIQKQSASGFEAALKTLPQVLSGGDFDKIMAGQMATVSPFAKQSTAAAIELLKSSLYSDLPSNPTQARQILAHRIVGASLGAGIPPDALNRVTGTPFTQDIGSQVLSGIQLPAEYGGAQVPAGALAKGVAPQIGTVQGPRGEPITGVESSAGMNPLSIGAPSQDSSASVDLIHNNLGIGPSFKSPAEVKSAFAAGEISRQEMEQKLGAFGPNALAPQRGQLAIGPTIGQQKYMGDRASAMAEYQKGLDSRVSIGAQIMQTVDSARDAMNHFKPGGGAAVYGKLAQFAQALGADKNLVDRIGNGDLGASQEFQKYMLNSVMGQIREQLNGVGASRLSQMEFSAFNQNNPNIDTDPRAIEKVFNFWTKIYKRDSSEQEQLNTWMSKGNDISLWPAEWQKRAIAQGYFSPKETNTYNQPPKARRPLSEFLK